MTTCLASKLSLVSPSSSAHDSVLAFRQNEQAVIDIYWVHLPNNVPSEASFLKSHSRNSAAAMGALHASLFFQQTVTTSESRLVTSRLITVASATLGLTIFLCSTSRHSND